MDAMSIASATGRSLSRVRRAGDGASIRGRRDGAFRDRMLSMLERVPFAEVPQGVIHPPPEIRSEKAFLPDTPELDRTLRAWVSDGDLRMVTKARSWPAGVHERFMHAIARMRSDFGVGFPPNAAAGDIVVLPPRRLVRANRESSLENGEALAWTRIDPEVMVGMGASWLRIASMPGVPDGIPGLSSDWSRWHEVMGSEFSSDWLRRSFGAAQCREPPPPPGSQVRAWPLLRWQCLLYWLRAQLRMSMVG